MGAAVFERGGRAPGYWLCLIEDPDIHAVLTTGASVYDYLEVIEDPRVARFAKDELCIRAYTKDRTPIIDDT